MNIGLWKERFSEFLELRGYAERTIYSYTHETGRFLLFLVEERSIEELHQLGREDILAYGVFLCEYRKDDGEPLSVSSRARRLSTVSRFLSFLHQEKFTLQDLSEAVILPKLPDHLPPEIPSEEEVFQLLESVETQEILGLRDRAILELLYGCALRNRELRRLQVDSVDFHRLDLRVKKGKGGKDRLLPLGEPAAVWLEAYLSKSRPHLLKSQEENHLFLNSRGKPLIPETLSDMVRKRAVQAGLPMKVTPHILRHACATHMLSRKASIRHLQKFLGHSQVSVTERYARVDISDLREVLLRCHPRES